MNRTLSAKRFLIAPLDWGLGHATRCIPIVRELLDLEQEVILAGRGPHIEVLSGEFPHLRVVSLPGYSMRYAATPLGLALRFPFMVIKVFRCAKLEHRRLREIVRDHHIDVVIADQRFGCFSRQARSVYISHQLCVKMPATAAPLERLVWRGLHRAANRFDEVWIPDFSGPENLTGDLTRKYPFPSTPHRFIGPLSRFAVDPNGRSAKSGPDVLVMLSGPEPQRSLLEKKVLRQLGTFDKPVIIVRGTVRGECPAGAHAGVRMVPHLPGAELQRLIAGAEAVVCRGGYTTIMEMISMGKKAVLIPTPGQTEQEYLCDRLAQRGRFVVERQGSINLLGALSRLECLPEPQPPTGHRLLAGAVSDVVSPLRGAR